MERLQLVAAHRLSCSLRATAAEMIAANGLA